MSRFYPGSEGSGIGPPQQDWVDRATKPDIAPGRNHSFQQPNPLPGSNTHTAIGTTVPGPRPAVYQRGLNYSVQVGTTPVPVGPKSFSDGFVIDCPSTAANSVFFGYGSSISTTSGLEIQAGIPLVFTPDNQREQWELQDPLEAILALLADQLGVPDPIQAVRTPRVVIDPSNWFLVASATTTVSVMQFLIPEMQ